MEKGYFVGGYGEDVLIGENIIFKYDKINIYDLEELLKVPAVENVVDEYTDFYSFDDEKKVKAIQDYILGDDIFRITYADSLETANKIKEDLEYLEQL